MAMKAKQAQKMARKLLGDKYTEVEIKLFTEMRIDEAHYLDILDSEVLSYADVELLYASNA